MIERPRVAPGYLAELKGLVYELYLAAGPVTLDEIAEMIQKDHSLAGAPGRDTVQRIIGGPDAPTSQADLAAVVTVLARAARADEEYVATRARDLWLEARMARPAGTPLEEVRDAFDLEVHRPVEAGGVTGLPPYVPRGHDAALAELARDAAAGRGRRLAVLVGDSSTGKTRACWETLEPLREAGGWRLWHPIAPARAQALLDGLANVGPRTVVWLNEAQEYLGGTDGERVAAALRELLRDPARGPMLVLGTLWPRYWAELTHRPTSGSDVHAQARELLSGRDITVAGAFTAAEIQAALRAGDARMNAAAAAADGRVTQFLAGTPELLARYRNAPPVARALIDSAVDARRLGMGEAIPLAFLERAVPGYLSDTEWEEEAAADDWLERGLAYTAEPCKGAHGPLTRIRSRPPAPGEPTGSTGPAYRLADYLDQQGRRARSSARVPTSFWSAAADCTANLGATKLLATAALDRDLLRYAAIFNKHAALLGEPAAAASLVLMLHHLHPDDDAPAQWAASYADLTNPTAVAGLLRALRVAGGGSPVRTLAARNPAAHASLDNHREVLNLMHALRDVGEDNQAEILGKRAVTNISLQDPRSVAVLLSTLLDAGEGERASELAARNPATHTSLGNLLSVVVLLAALQKAGAYGQAKVLAQRAAADGPLENPTDVALLLDVLRMAGAQEQLAALLARDPAGHAPLDDPATATVLLKSLRTAGAQEQVAALLARDPVRHASFGDPPSMQRVLHALRTMGEEEKAVLLARVPVAEISLDNGLAVGVLLDQLLNLNAARLFAAFAKRAAADMSLDEPSSVMFVLQTLRRTGANGLAATLLARYLANTPLVDADAVLDLLRSLRHEREDDQAAALEGRLSSAGLFRLLETADTDGLYVFGREPDGSPAGPWGWDDIAEAGLPG